MPGFGHGPFGRQPFGHAPWGRDVRFGLLPTEYRQQDEANGYALQRYSEAVGGLQEEQRQLIRRFPDLRDPLRVPAGSGGQLLTLGMQVLRYGRQEQYGVDGQVLPDGSLQAPTARFGRADFGKYLIVSGSTEPGNNRAVRIVLAVSPTVVLTDPPLATDAGPLRWSLRPPQTADVDHVVLELQGGDAQRIRPGWVLYDGAAEFPVLGRASFPDRGDIRLPPIRQQGSDGSIDTQGRFVSPTSTLTSSDTGRPFALFDSTYRNNRGVFLVAAVEDTGEIRLVNQDGSAPDFVTDSGPLTWAARARAVVTVQGPALPLGVQRQEGTDLVLSVPGATATIVCPSARFLPEDVGRSFSVLYPAGESVATVQSVLSGQSLVVQAEQGGVLSAGTGLAWRLRTAARVVPGQTGRVLVRPPSFLGKFAADHGLVDDNQEPELRRRAWVATAPLWTKLKGTAQGYRVVGALSGATVEPESLFRVSTEIGEALPFETRVELQEWSEGRHGTAATLSLGDAGAVRLVDLSARFTRGDQGLVLRVTASDGGLTRAFTVNRILSATTVEFRPSEHAPVPDIAVHWYMARLYATEPPTMARFDDFDVDLMEELIDGLPPQTTDHWSADRWCWEAGTVEQIAVAVTAVAEAPEGRYLVTVVGRADVVTWPGAWKIVDVQGRSFFLETTPSYVDAAPTFTCYVAARVAPAVGAANLVYVCETQLSCDYCASATVRLTVTADLGNAGPQEVDRFQTRLLARLEEVRPEHVRLVPLFTGEVLAGFGTGSGLSATVDTE